MTENDKNEIKVEIENLRKLKSKWNKQHPNKQVAYDLITEINLFDHTFDEKFKFASIYYKQDPSVDIDFEDATSDLRLYATSSLKQKDNPFFYQGVENIQYAIESLINILEQKIN